jgi:hypothetical protein
VAAAGDLHPTGDRERPCLVAAGVHQHAAALEPLRDVPRSVATGARESARKVVELVVPGAPTELLGSPLAGHRVAVPSRSRDTGPSSETTYTR